MSRYRTTVDQKALKACREHLLECGVDLTPAALKGIIKHAVEIAGYLASGSVALEVADLVFLKVDLEKQSALVIRYGSEEDA